MRIHIATVKFTQIGITLQKGHATGHMIMHHIVCVFVER